MNFHRLMQPDAAWLDAPTLRQTLRLTMLAGIGLAAYGFSIGFWRSPLMGCFVAVKLPLLVALTLICNSLLNGLLGVLLGSGLGFRQSLFALLTSFAIAGVILGSLAPVTLLMAWNAPPPDSPYAGNAHSSYLVLHTALIGFAGIMATLRLHQLLLARAPSETTATVTLLAWLGGNGFLGAQFSWILRPFFGAPHLDVQFIRSNPLQGNFYQCVWDSMSYIFGDFRVFALLMLLLLLAIPVLRSIRSNHPTIPKP